MKLKRKTVILISNTPRTTDFPNSSSGNTSGRNYNCEELKKICNNLSDSDKTPVNHCPTCGFSPIQDPNQNKNVIKNAGICPECHHVLEILNVGYFIVYGDKEDSFDIVYHWCPGKDNDAIPTEKKKLLEEIMATNTIIKSLYFSYDDDTCVSDREKNDAIKKKYFDKLLSLARVGLTGDKSQVELSEAQAQAQEGLIGDKARLELAKLALVQLKEELTTVEGQRIKNTYMKELGMRAFLSSLIALMLFFITSTSIFFGQATFADLLLKKPTSIFIFQNDFLAVISMFSIIWIGAMLGTWVSFAARNKTIDFERLSILETDRIVPTIRLIYMGICAIIFSLFLSSGIVALEVGGLSTANIANSIGTQFVIGLLCGLTESQMGIFIHERTQNIISNKKKAAE